MPTLLHPELLLQAYASGLFPMGENAESEETYWVDPPERAIIPLDKFHVPTRLVRSVRKGIYNISVNRCFADVINACSSVPRGQKTWINPLIRRSYTKLHEMGFAHSIEVWKDISDDEHPNSPPLEGGAGGGVRKGKTSASSVSKSLPSKNLFPAAGTPPLYPLPQGEGKILVGGLYGVSLGKAFFGESMFTLARDASKIALVHLVARLVKQGYTLLDAQFTNPHLVQFGTQEITREEYHSVLSSALGGEAFFGADEGFDGERSLTSGFLQSRTQIS
jgi:leucyl/phenylalanyl-tRNA--protein transferase